MLKSLPTPRLKITEDSYTLDLPEFEYLRKKITALGFGNAKFLMDYNEFQSWADGVIKEYHEGQLMLKEFNDFAEELKANHDRMMEGKNISKWGLNDAE